MAKINVETMAAQLSLVEMHARLAREKLLTAAVCDAESKKPRIVVGDSSLMQNGHARIASPEMQAVQMAAQLNAQVNGHLSGLFNHASAINSMLNSDGNTGVDDGNKTKD